MMGALNAITAKIKARRARLLNQQGYMELCRGQNMPVSLRLEDDLRMIRHYGVDVTFPIRDKPCRESLRRVRGMELDLRNILWIWRLKTYHGVDGDGVFAFLSPHMYKLGLTEIRQLAFAKSTQEFLQILQGGAYPSVFRNHKDGIMFGEQDMARAVMAQLHKESRQCDFALIYSYLYARHYEIKNINAISVGLKHGLPAEEIFSRIY
ncbi:MAG: V-type ATPase subunit [Defluviitaleaceae bacterium]|nr:V-type ATPase subunit [Defluviitaleaceae bacterium]